MLALGAKILASAWLEGFRTLGLKGSPENFASSVMAAKEIVLKARARLLAGDISRGGQRRGLRVSGNVWRGRERKRGRGGVEGGA